MAHRLWPLSSIVVLMALSAACSGDDRDSTPTSVPLSEVDREQVAGFAELVHRADIIAEVTPSGPVGTYWDSSGLLVATRFSLEIQDVLKGDVKAGDSVLAHVPGGEVRATTDAHGSRKPSQGDQVILTEDVVSPFYVQGRNELVFLEFVGELPGIGPIYFDLGWGSRYRADGQFLSVAEGPTTGRPADQPRPDQDWRAALHGRPLSEAKAEIRREVAASP